MTAMLRLSKIYDRGLQGGLDSLSITELDLYHIQDFIIEYEMNGLSGYFYNRLSDIAKIHKALSAMYRYNLVELHDFLDEAFGLFKSYDASKAQGTWSDVLRMHDPDNRLETISRKINALDDYGLASSSIV